IDTKISVDTMHAVTAEKALTLGVDWINDVTGFQDSNMRHVVSQSNADCVVMHHICIPPERSKVLPRDQDPAEFLINWSRERIALLAKDGIRPERIIIDPGIGFGTTYGQAISLFRNIEKFKELGVRILVGHSRKQFMTTFTHHASSERDIETTAITMHLARQPIDYIRVHNVEMSSRAIKVDADLKA
ncbi:MAG TPA: dihydropteroate synthase, partial [Gammaproteobacteria bacterium]|nr:dihydropteroate synthase [Gammaproteobacteria bacterium]